MMFFQYMMFAVWWIPLAAYLSEMGLTRGLTALILSSMAFGSITAPMVGSLADRYFRGQYVLATCNILVGIMLLIAASVSNGTVLFVVLFAGMLFYMPTWGLTSSIALSGAPSHLFPRIRVFGTVGWILAGVFSAVSVGWFNRDFDGTNIPFYFGAGLSFLGALVNLTLPDTPAKGKGTRATLIDIMGFRSFVLFRNRNYATFMIIFFLAMIPFSMYWSYFSEYLASSGYRLITVTMSTGQMLELVILLSVPFSIKKIGLHKTMLIGIIALVIRYVSLYFAGNEATLGFVLLGAGVHGIIFGYYHLGAQIYTDQIAPDHLKAQAQGMIFFITFAMGLLAGNFVCGWIINIFSTQGPSGLVYQWDKIWGITALMSVFILFAYLIFFKEKDITVAPANQDYE